MRLAKRSFLALIIIFVLIIFSSCTDYITSQEKLSNQKIDQNKSNIILPMISFSTKEIYPGDYFVINIADIETDDKITCFSQITNENPLFFQINNEKIVLLGVSYYTPPGQYTFSIEITRDGNELYKKQELINVLPKEFPKQYLKVSKVQESLRNNKLLQEDLVHVKKAKETSSSKSLWKENFILPVNGRISTEFGIIRYINQNESGRHSGIDIAAPLGTPIKATNSGIVCLAMPLNVTGNTIIIDHGMNLFSAYSHLNSILVQKGAIVEKGDVIGKVGSTGFSTGPHLHWTISIGSTYINPWLLIQEDPLKTIKKQL